jgi:protein ImuA
MLPADMEQISRLRRAIAKSEALPEEVRPLKLGVPEIDAALGGGLSRAALHELSATALHLGAAAGFALTLASLASDRAKQTLWIATDFGALETGALYGPGLDQIGLSTERLLNVRVARPVDALFAAEEALKCRALSVVVAELSGEADLTSTRRLTLAARESGAIGLLLHHKLSDAPSAAFTRWHVEAAPSIPDEFNGLGPTTFHLSLTRNRRGPSGAWTLTWNHHERTFSALSVGVAAAPADRPDREALSA